jgi:hypothetical protein
VVWTLFFLRMWRACRGLASAARRRAEGQQLPECTLDHHVCFFGFKIIVIVGFLLCLNTHHLIVFFKKNRRPRSHSPPFLPTTTTSAPLRWLRLAASSASRPHAGPVLRPLAYSQLFYFIYSLANVSIFFSLEQDHLINLREFRLVQWTLGHEKSRYCHLYYETEGEGAVSPNLPCASKTSFFSDQHTFFHQPGRLQSSCNCLITTNSKHFVHKDDWARRAG